MSEQQVPIFQITKFRPRASIRSVVSPICFDFEEFLTPDPIRKPQYHVHTSAKPEFHIPSIPINCAKLGQSQLFRFVDLS